MKQAIVTGANGFLGSHLCNELVNRNIKVIAVIQPGTDITELVKNRSITIYSCDLDEYDSLDKVIRENNADVMYHFAWKGTSGDVRGDYEMQLDNVKSACKALEVCKKIGVQRFVFASSIMEYEIAKAMQTTEEPSINTLYSSSKLATNYMLRALATKLDICYVRALISNIYGPKEMSPRLINTTIRKLLKGEHCSFSEGSQMYDFIYIDDAINKLIAIGENGISQQSYYIGSEKPKALKKFLVELRDVVAPNAELGFGEIGFQGVSLNYDEFDIYAIKNEMGIVNNVSFKEGISRTSRWMKEKFNPGYTFNESKLRGAYLISNFSVGDNRGGFVKCFEKDIYKTHGIDFSLNETFISTSSKNVIRGLHFQTKNPQAKLVSVPCGSVYDVIVDLRKESDTYGQWCGYYLSAKEHNALYVPRGFAHGFMALEDGTQVMYQCDGAYDKNSDTGIRFDDSDIGIEWPIESIDDSIHSVRDLKLMSFKEYTENFAVLSGI